MQLKKIAIVFLVVIMMFSLAAIGIAAEEAGSEFSLSAKVESDNALANSPLYVKSGNVIKYVISVDSNPGELAQIEIRATFDSAVLTFKKATYGSVFDMDNVLEIKSEADVANANGLVRAWVLAEEDYRSDATGAFITLEFEVSDEFDGSIDAEGFSFSYAAYSLGDGSLQNYDLVAPAVHAHHYGEPSSVAGDCTNSGATVYECATEGCTDAKLTVPTGVYGDHNKVKVERVEPTVDKAGNEEHYKCSICNKLFDAEGNEISYPSIPKLEKSNDNNTVVTVIIIVVAVLVVAAGAVAAVVVLKKKKIL